MQSPGRSQPHHRLFIDFVNTEWYDGYGNLDDRLTEKGRRSEVARSLDLDLSAAPSSADITRLRELRSAIRSLIEANERGVPVPSRALHRVNAAVRSMPLVYELRPDKRLAWSPVRASGKGPKLAEARIALSAVLFLASEDAPLLKSCENPGCRWVFLDETKNGSRRWCDTARCGNMMRVRRYRSRRILESGVVRRRRDNRH
jgi:predicted RNA-binding Zn ribbon-like protein